MMHSPLSLSPSATVPLCSLLLSARGHSHDPAPLARLVPPGSGACTRNRLRAFFLKRIRVSELERAWESVAVCHHNNIVGISRNPAVTTVCGRTTAALEKKSSLPHRNKGDCLRYHFSARCHVCLFL